MSHCGTRNLNVRYKLELGEITTRRQCNSVYGGTTTQGMETIAKADKTRMYLTILKTMER